MTEQLPELMKSVLTRHMAAMQRQFKDRNLTIGASEIGRCIRMIWYIKHHPAAKAMEGESYGASHRGNMIEAHTVVPALKREFKDNIIYVGKDQQTLADGINSATPDGLLINQPKDLLSMFGINDIGKDRCVLVEVKSIDPRINLRGPKPEHARQANQQLGVVRATTKHKPEFCILMYVNASFMDEVTEFVIRFDPDQYEKQKKRAARIMDSRTAREMQPEGWIMGGKECDNCGFAEPCTLLRSNLPAEGSGKVDPQLVAEIKELGKKERDIDARVSALQVEQREMQVVIKDRLREKSLRGIKEPDITVSWYPIKPRVTYDMDALRIAAEAVHFDIARFERVGLGSDALRITIKDLFKPTAMKGESPKAKLSSPVGKTGTAKEKTAKTKR